MIGSKISFSTKVRLLPALAACVLLSACYHMPPLNPPPGPVYDVRSVTVVSANGASPRLLSEVSTRVNAAIAATRHAVTEGAVALTIHITQSERAQGYEKNRNSAKVDIDASAIDTGSVVAVNSFESTTFSADSDAIDDLMAEDIAARIRAAYGLTAPRPDN